MLLPQSKRHHGPSYCTDIESLYLANSNQDRDFYQILFLMQIWNTDPSRQ